MTTSRRLWPPVLALAALLAGAQAARSEASPPQGEDPPGAEDGTAPSRAPHSSFRRRSATRRSKPASRIRMPVTTRK
jgi:hypothetical protein